MKKQKLTYRFHDPNPPGAAAEYILKVLMEANAPEVERAIREAMEKAEQTTEAVKLDDPPALEWTETLDKQETLEWEPEPYDQEEAEETEPEQCQSQGWTMAMM